MSRHVGILADKSRTRPTKQLIGVLWSYLREYKKQLVLISFIIFTYTLAATALPIVIQRGLDLVIGSDSETKNSELTTLIVIFIILSVLVWVVQSINQWIMAGIRTDLVHDIRTDTFNALVKADMSYHHKNQSGNITSRVVSDTDQIATGLNVFTQTTTQLLLLGATIVVLFAISWIFVAIALFAVPVAFLVARFFGTSGKKRMLQTRQAYGHVSGKLAENLAGVSIAKSFNQEDRISDEIRTLNTKTAEFQKQLFLVFILVFPAISMVSTILVFGILVTGGWISSTSSISIGFIFLGTVMVQRFLQPLVALANNFTALQASLAAIDRITDVRDAVPAVQDSLNAQSLQVERGEIGFSNVSFSYDEGTEVLSDINFRIQAGSKLALVGHTGAGKTTITSLLMRFYDPSEGQITIDGQDLKDITLASLYENVSLVSQEPYLFADTVLENIRYGKPGASDEDIYDLCTLIGANEFIEALPAGYNTILQESGKSLSAGQRQMITIARTMLSDPTILVLDEATSRLDAYSEALVQNAQRILFEGRTTIIIAHRLSTIRDVDNIIVIDNGKLTEMGNHDSLMKNHGVYSELYNMYYAHQSIGPLEVAEVLTTGEQVSVVQNGKTNLALLMTQRIEFYTESIGKRIPFTIQDDEVFLLDGDSKSYERILDGMIHQMNSMAKMTQRTPKFEFSLSRVNGEVRVSLSDRSFIQQGPIKMKVKMGGSVGQGHSGVQMRMGGQTPEGLKSLSEMAEDLNGNFKIASPIEGEESGMQFVATFKLPQE